MLNAAGSVFLLLVFNVSHSQLTQVRAHAGAFVMYGSTVFSCCVFTRIVLPSVTYFCSVRMDQPIACQLVSKHPSNSPVHSADWLLAAGHSSSLILVTDIVFTVQLLCGLDCLQ